MSSRILLPLCALLALSVPAAAQNCAGFTDLTVFSSFCTNVTWMKNRAITLGCTATAYCPNDSVSRLQMAAFMNRVGNVVTPNVLDVEGSGGAMTITAENFVCATPDIPAATYDRTAIGNADFSFDLTGPQDVVVNLMYSDDAGQSWTLFGSNVIVVDGDATVRMHASTVAGPQNHNLGAARRYAVRVVRGTQNLNQSITGWTCHLQVFLRTTAQ